MTTPARLTVRHRLPMLGHKPIRQVATELTGLTTHTRTGILHVAGDPGGDFQVACGQVVAVLSPGAPGVADLLARPGCASMGDAELRALAAMAAIDGTFAIAAGWIDGCYWNEIPNDPPAEFATGTGVEPDWLLVQTERRLRALANGRVSPHRNRLSLTGLGTRELGRRTTGLHHEILRKVNGRRTCRDLAFLLGRSLYPVTAAAARLLAEDLLMVPPPYLDDRTSTTVPADDPAALPRRRRGASGINDALPPRAPQAVLRSSAPREHPAADKDAP
ncbi:hypothetical protein [Nocardia sp. NPDC049149]|uniref:hypothetical protein n=1 Tax=Nocardia sp. NPDC049149 TaxID=3364315 RepID=UPI0037105E97